MVIPADLGSALTQLAPAPVPGVVTVELPDGALLVDERYGITFPLTSSGAVLWACFDGVSSLHEISVDVSEILGVPYDRVVADADTLARSLLDHGYATATGYDPPRDAEPGHADPCCSGSPRVDQREHTHDAPGADPSEAVWLPERVDLCRDLRFPLGRAGEVVARLVAADGTERLVGVRTNDADAAEELRSRLGARLRDVPMRFPNVSLRIGDRRGTLTDATIVFRREVEAFHTFSREVAIEAALAQLHTFLPPAVGLTPLHARVLERDGAAVLVSDAFATAVDAQHRRLAAAGFATMPHTPVLVDAVEGKVVVPRGGDRLSPDLDRVTLARVLLPGSDPDPSWPAAVQLSVIKRLVANHQRPLRAADLRSLDALVSAVPVEWIPTWDPRRVADAVIADPRP